MAQSFTHQFLAFCRSKPADEEYDNGDAGMCALAQFGYPGANLSTIEAQGIPREVYWAAGLQEPATFGALTTRLEAALVTQVPA
jgi:hypothetical protein